MKAASTKADLHAQILIVDDEADHAEVMAEALSRPGHICTIVHSLADIIIIFKNFKQSFDQIADVNEDGKVNLFDVVKVARHLGEDV